MLFKKIWPLIFLLALPMTIVFSVEPLWHCTVKSKNDVYWYQYGKTQEIAKSASLQACYRAHQKECNIVCMLPRVYYRCVAHDTPTKPTETRGTWYWSSYSQSVAIHGALDACRHNSLVGGGCYVNSNQCVSS